MDLDKLKYPVGTYQPPVEFTDEQFDSWVGTLATLPEKLKKRVANLSINELEYAYRPGGWTINQVVHHLADSHMNSFVRFKLILTEENPTIKPYNETKWAQTIDANNEDIGDSLSILEGLHNRWVKLLKGISDEDRLRPFIHPEYNESLTFQWMVGLYDWHSRHHLAHIAQAIEKQGKFQLEKA